MRGQAPVTGYQARVHPAPWSGQVGTRSRGLVAATAHNRSVISFNVVRETETFPWENEIFWAKLTSWKYTWHSKSLGFHLHHEAPFVGDQFLK